jgi:adenylosuccinate synthase
MQMAADMGVPHQKIGEVIMVIRPYPIRVGNVMRNGRMTGHSGDWYPDQSELTWEEIGVEPEITTVTGRKRRVASFSEELLRQSIQIMNPTQIALNFANYLDPSFSEVGGYMNLDMLRKKWPTIFNFVATVEKQTDTPITLLGSGPQINHVVRITR